MFAKFARRTERMNPAFAFVLTFLEAIATLLLLRFAYRAAMRLVRGKRRPAGPGTQAEVQPGD